MGSDVSMYPKTYFWSENFRRPIKDNRLFAVFGKVSLIIEVSEKIA